jgi:hypothetical protein
VTAGNELVVLDTAHIDLPELQRATLLDRDGDDLQPTAAVGAHEVGDVGDSDGLLSSLLTGS